MKTVYSNTVSVTKGSNIIISTSDDNWSGVKEGSSIRIGKDKLFYDIANVERFMHIKDFNLEGNLRKRISVQLGETQCILPNDSIKISYKEFQVFTISQINSGGKGYKRGDEITIEGGKASIDNQTGLYNYAKFRVLQVNQSGKIEKLAIEFPGKYLSLPNSVTECEGGNGKGAILKLEYDVTENRSVVERYVEFVNIEGKKAVIHLNIELPNFITKGKVSVEKWKMELSSNYSGETNSSNSYEILKDFAPYSTIPYMHANSTNPEAVYNLGMKRIATRIHNLEEMVKELYNKLDIRK